MQYSVSKNSTTPSSWLVSLVFHTVVIGGIIFISQAKPLPEVELMEASLATGSDMAGMKAQIASMYAKNQAAQKQSVQTDNQTSNTTISEQSQAYNDDLLQKQKAYEAQMQAFAKALDDEITSEMYAQRQAQKAEDEERQRQVNELKNNERSNTQIAQENSKELNKAKETQKQATHQNSSNEQGSDNDIPKTPTVGQGGSINGGQSSGGQGTSKNDVISALQAHIKRYWTPTGNNQTLQVSLQVDEHGNVLNVHVGGGTDALRSALEDTIKRASPLTPIEGTSYRNLNFNFKIN